MSADSDNSNTGAAQSPAPAPPHQQPKWAWWVVGIAVPLLGVAATLAVSSSEPAESPPERPANDQSQQDAAGPSESDTKESASSAPVRFGPAEVTVRIPDGPDNVDLDSSPPLVADTKGADIYVGATTEEPTIGTEDSALTLAPLPQSSAKPTEAECAAQIESNGAYTGTLTRGSQFCVQTVEGRTAFFRVSNAPTNGPVRLQTTVWELPGE